MVADWKCYRTGGSYAGKLGLQNEFYIRWKNVFLPTEVHGAPLTIGLLFLFRIPFSLFIVHERLFVLTQVFLNGVAGGWGEGRAHLVDSLCYSAAIDRRLDGKDPLIEIKGTPPTTPWGSTIIIWQCRTFVKVFTATHSRNIVFFFNFYFEMTIG
jgi:hypothetical protein